MSMNLPIVSKSKKMIFKDILWQKILEKFQREGLKKFFWEFGATFSVNVSSLEYEKQLNANLKFLQHLKAYSMGWVRVPNCTFANISEKTNYHYFQVELL